MKYIATWEEVIDIFYCSNGPEYEAICKVFDKKIINEIMEELKK